MRLKHETIIKLGPKFCVFPGWSHQDGEGPLAGRHRRYHDQHVPGNREGTFGQQNHLSRAMRQMEKVEAKEKNMGREELSLENIS